MNNISENAGKSQLKPEARRFGLGTKGFINTKLAFEEDAADLDFVLDGIVAGTVGAVVAAGATGKSFMMLSAVIDVATGKNMIGLNAKESTNGCVYLTIEDPAQVLHKRLHQIGKELTQEEKEKVNSRVIFESQVGSMLHLVDQVGHPNRQLIEDMCVAFQGKRLVVLDTLRRFHAANENDSGPMAVLIGCLEEIAARTGAAIVFLHHVNKASIQTGSGGSQAASRGSAVLTDNIRCQLNLSLIDDKTAQKYGIPDSEKHLYVQLVNAKPNYQARTSEFFLKRNKNGVLKHIELTGKTSLMTVAKGRGKR